MQIKRTQHLTVHSKKRTGGRPSRFSLTVPDLLIEASPTEERFRISLQTLQIPYTWYQINEGMNRLTTTNLHTNQTQTYEVTPGTYSYHDLAKHLRTLYPACAARYMEQQNTMLLSTTVPHRWVFEDGLAQILGFEPEVPYEGAAVMSPNVCRPLATESIYVHVTNLPCMDDAVNLTNLSGNVMPDTCLAKIPVTDTPSFHVVSYYNDIDLGMFTSDYKLTILDFVLTNEDGVELTFLPDFVMTLKIDTYDNDTDHPILEQVRAIRSDVNDLLMTQVLRS